MEDSAFGIKEWLSRLNEEIYDRATLAKMHILRASKIRRDARRHLPCKERAAEFELKRGRYMSWGYGSMTSEFDEYFGEIDSETRVPNGVGVRYYSDGTAYYGKWLQGVQQDAGEAIWRRSNGYIYVGGWIQGKKNGFGSVKYPTTDDRETYQGEFANGVEHGKGELIYRDKSMHRGKFRFGVRDGVGVSVDSLGQGTKGVFRSPVAEAYIDSPPPKVYEDNPPNVVVYNPKSLLELAMRCLHEYYLAIPQSYHMCPKSLQCVMKYYLALEYFIPRADLFKRYLVMEFYSVYDEINRTKRKADEMSSTQKVLMTGSYVFEPVKECSFKWIKMSDCDIAIIIMLQGGNQQLSSLSLIGCNLSANAVYCIGIHLSEWHQLRHLDISCNKILSIDCIVKGALKSLLSLRLQACSLSLSHIEAVAKELLKSDAGLIELDVSFNKLGVEGVRIFTELIKTKKCWLSSLMLRSTEISEEGAELLADALQGNEILSVLNVSDNSIKPTTITAIAARLKGSFTTLKASFKPDEIVPRRRYSQLLAKKI